MLPEDYEKLSKMLPGDRAEYIRQRSSEMLAKIFGKKKKEEPCNMDVKVSTPEKTTGTHRVDAPLMYMSPDVIVQDQGKDVTLIVKGTEQVIEKKEMMEYYSSYGQVMNNVPRAPLPPTRNEAISGQLKLGIDVMLMLPNVAKEDKVVVIGSNSKYGGGGSYQLLAGLVKEVHLYDPAEPATHTEIIEETRFEHYKSVSPLEVKADVVFNDAYLDGKIVPIKFDARAYSLKSFGEKQRMESNIYYQVRTTAQKETREVYPPRELQPYTRRDLGNCPACRELMYFLPQNYDIPRLQRLMWTGMHGQERCSISADVRRYDQIYASTITYRVHISPVGRSEQCYIPSDIIPYERDATMYISTHWWNHRTRLMKHKNFVVYDTDMQVYLAGGEHAQRETGYKLYGPPYYREAKEVIVLPENHYMKRVLYMKAERILVIDYEVRIIESKPYQQDTRKYRNQLAKQQRHNYVVKEFKEEEPSIIRVYYEGKEIQYRSWQELDSYVSYRIKVMSREQQIV